MILTKHTLKEDLIEAKSVLLAAGWSQQANCRDGRRCLEEAVAIAVGVDPRDWGKRTNKRQVRALRALMIQVSGEWAEAAEKADPLDIQVWPWNDTPWRTFEEVISLVDKAIEKEGES